MPPRFPAPPGAPAPTALRTEDERARGLGRLREIYPDPEPVDLDPLHRVGEAYVNAQINARRAESEAARQRAERAMALQQFVNWGTGALQVFSGTPIEGPDFRQEAVTARTEADRQATESEGQAGVDRAGFEVDRQTAELREAARYADRLQEARVGRAREAERVARQEAEAQREAAAAVQAAVEAEREEAADLYADMIAAGREGDAAALYRTANPLATTEQAAAAVAAAREAHLLDVRGDRALVQSRERANRRRGSGGASGAGASGRSSLGQPPPAPPPPSGRSTTTTASTPPGIAAPPSRLAQRLGLDVEASNPFGARPLLEDLSARENVARALADGGPARAALDDQVVRVLALPAGARREALEGLLAELDGLPGGDLLTDYLLAQLGY